MEEFIQSGLAVEMHSLVKSDRQFTVVFEPLVRTTLLVYILPCPANYLGIRRHALGFDRLNRMGPHRILFRM